MLPLNDVLAGTGGQLDWAIMDRASTQVYSSDVSFDMVEVDSRKLRPGGLFVALRGENTDGHRYIGDAIGRGARGILLRRDFQYHPTNSGGLHPAVALIRVDEPLAALQQLATYWRHKLNPRVVGITGSVGKTSTKEVTAAVLSKGYRVLKSEGNYNSETGLPITLLRLTPGIQTAVLEMGGGYTMHDISDLAAIAQPEVGVITNVGESHLERMGTIENVATMKSELVRALPASGWAVLNADDERVRAMANLTKARTFFYGFDNTAHLWAEQIEGRGLEGIAFVLCYEPGKLQGSLSPALQQSQRLHLHLPLLGQHSVNTALAAASVGLVMGLDWVAVAAGLEDAGTSTSGAQLRILSVPGVNGSTIIDDSYNASPASVLAALNLLNEMRGGKVAVLGDMLELGEQEVTGHLKVAARARQVTNRLVVIGTLGHGIGRDAISYGMAPEAVYFASDNDDAAAWLRRKLQAGDTVLVKGSRSLHLDEIVQKVRA